MSDLSKVCERLGNRALPHVLQARLADLEGYWLELRCCGQTRLLPFRLILQKRDAALRIADILPRLQCPACHSQHRYAWLNETPHRIACNGPEPGWSVQLIPPGPELAGATE